MESELLYELIGYAASLLVAVSLMMSAIVKLRIVNMIGAIIFTVYGILIDSMPVAAMNAFIVLVNLYHLFNIYRNRTQFELLKLDWSNPVLKKFLNYYRDNIKKHQPGFTDKKLYSFSLMILNDMVPVGVVLGNRENGILHLDLDFVIPSHRDFKAGTFLYQQNSEFFQNEGIQAVQAKSGDTRHNDYLVKMGFSEKENGNYYELNLKN